LFKLQAKNVKINQMTQPTTKTDSATLEKELEDKIETINLHETEDKAKELAVKTGYAYFNLKAYPVDGTALATISEDDARASRVAVVHKTGTKLRVAVADPDNTKTKEILIKLAKDGYICELIVVSQASLNLAWKHYQSRKDSPDSALGVVKITDKELSETEKQIKSIGDLKERLTSMPVTQILNILIAGALKIGASDIHFEAEEKNIRLRYRLDGVLNDIVDISTSGYKQLLSRIKLMSGLKLNIHDAPQDGRFTIRREDSDIEVRVSILPGNYGENIVMRILDPSTIKQKLEDLGMSPGILEKVKKLLDKTTGAILTTGPTGSGKTTTLYAFIKHVNSSDIKVITIEDPVEYHIEGITQTQVDAEAGYTFAGGLRSIVRQDPDVILIGEIRDLETAEIAMQAALTGHLVFSTLHTNNSAGTIPRLIDLGVKPVTIAPAINAIMAQRLVRRVCPKCGKKEKIKTEDYEKIKDFLKKTRIEALKKIDENTEFVYPQKCLECNQTGYSGRVGVYELFEIDPDLEKLIQKSPGVSEMQDMAMAKGMITLLEDGLLKAIDGKTTIEEVLRVIGQ